MVSADLPLRIQMNSIKQETEDVVEEVPLRAIVGGEVSELNPSDRRGAVDAELPNEQQNQRVRGLGDLDVALRDLVFNLGRGSGGGTELREPLDNRGNTCEFLSHESHLGVLTVEGADFGTICLHNTKICMAELLRDCFRVAHLDNV